jgi:hypothetical protein
MNTDKWIEMNRKRTCQKNTNTGSFSKFNEKVRNILVYNNIRVILVSEKKMIVNKMLIVLIFMICI